MKAEQKDIPPKLYRTMLKNYYNETHNLYQKNKNFQNKKTNPILQKEDRYVAPRGRGEGLKQQYMKNLAEKTERPHIKRFKVQSNLENNMTVITEPRKIRAIQLGPKHDTHPLSAERRVVRKKMFPEGNKNFYYDAFNSIKENQNDLVKDIKNTVSYYIFNFFQKRFECRPKKPKLEFGYAEPKLIKYGNIYGYERKEVNTRERIFPTEANENKNKTKEIRRNNNNMFYRTLTNNRRNDLSCDFVPYDRNKEKMTKMTSKPCNTDFKILSDEAKKNGSLRYYFESNLSHL